MLTESLGLSPKGVELILRILFSLMAGLGGYAWSRSVKRGRMDLGGFGGATVSIWSIVCCFPLLHPLDLARIFFVAGFLLIGWAAGLKKQDSLPRLSS